MDNPSIRPPTPQPLLHRAPDRSNAGNLYNKPTKYIVLLLAPTSVAGKVQIATSVAKALGCPIFQGDSLHESSAKAALVGADRSEDRGKGRYQRMWMSKLTRTGLLFPEESRPANEGFFGFGGASLSTSTSRRGSTSSVSSTTSSSDISTLISSKPYSNQPILPVLENAKFNPSNPALMVLTHPDIEPWHKDAILETTEEYGIGVIIIPLFACADKYDGEAEVTQQHEPPVLQPLSPSAISGFTSFDALRAAAQGIGKDKALMHGPRRNTQTGEVVLRVHVDGTVEEIIDEIVNGVQDIFLS